MWGLSKMMLVKYLAQCLRSNDGDDSCLLTKWALLPVNKCRLHNYLVRIQDNKGFLRDGLKIIKTTAAWGKDLKYQETTSILVIDVQIQISLKVMFWFILKTFKISEGTSRG